MVQTAEAGKGDDLAEFGWLIWRWSGASFSRARCNLSRLYQSRNSASRRWACRLLSTMRWSKHSLADDIAELQEFPVNPGTAPSSVLLRNQPDETPDLGSCRRAAG
jgi:hypothetical protein